MFNCLTFLISKARNIEILKYLDNLYKDNLDNFYKDTIYEKDKYWHLEMQYFTLDVL